MNKIKAIVAVLLLVGLLAACGSVPGTEDYNDKHGVGDAPTGDKDDSKKAVIQFPDGFSNVSYACDGHGHRVYVTTQNASGKELEVIDDEACG